MSLSLRLIIMNFLQFFIWGSWLITVSAYWFQNKEWSNTNFGAIFSTMGISAIFMPAISGIIADKFINAERLYAVYHIIAGLIFLYLPQVDDPNTFFWVLLLAMVFYMPTLSLSISVAYTALRQKNFDVVKKYPPIRVFGTIGFIAALWTVSLMGWEKTSGQFYLAAIASIILGISSFTLPACPPPNTSSNQNFLQSLGLNAFVLFKDRKMFIFFVFAMFLGAALQLTNAWGDTFLHDFDKDPAYQNLWSVKYPAIIMSISQISETVFILTIPFFLRKFGIKTVMLFSMIAWVLRFGLFAYGDPGDGLWMIILSCIIYGLAFDFFNISGSLYVETNSPAQLRSSSQGLFMMMVNGFGAILGSFVSGILIDQYFTATDGAKDWENIWLSFAIYAAIIAVFFAVVFRHKHVPNEEAQQLPLH